MTKFDQGLTGPLTRPKVESNRLLPDHSEEHDESFDSTLYGPKTDEKRGSYGQNCEKTYLGGNVCAKILSDLMQLGPRTEVIKRKGYSCCRMQLPDRQELLRSSRNLDQKTVPSHKKHSNGLRSQDHILRTQACLCARPVPLENR